MPLKRPCKRCNKMFQPTGKSCRICSECLKSSQNKGARTRKGKYYGKEEKKL